MKQLFLYLIPTTNSSNAPVSNYLIAQAVSCWPSADRLSGGLALRCGPPWRRSQAGPRFPFVIGGSRSVHGYQRWRPNNVTLPTPRLYETIPHIEVKPGDRVPLKGTRRSGILGGGKVIDKP